MRYLYTLLAVALSQWTSSAAYAQWTEDEYLDQSVTSCLDVAEQYLQQQSRYGYAAGISLVSTLLEPGQTFTFDLQLAGGTDYAVVAAGDVDATDVDLRITDRKGNLVIEDLTTNADAMAEFHSGLSGQYTIEVKLYGATQNAFVTFVVLQDGGQSMPRYDIDSVKREFLDLWALANANLKKQVGDRLHFNREPNQPCLVGGLVAGNQSLTVTDLNFGGEEMLAIAVGGPGAPDIDLVLRDEHGFQLEADFQYNCDAFINSQTATIGDYELEVLNVSLDPVFCLLGISQIR